MNRNTIILALALIATGTAYLFLNPDRRMTGEQEPARRVTPQAVAPSTQPGARQEDAAAERRAAMRAEYARLEQAREALRKQLGLLKSRIWKLRVPPDRARAIRQQLQQGYALLKNPPLLGAFADREDITREIEKVTGVSAGLQALEVEVAELLASQ